MRKRKERAYTLVELLIVIATLTLIAAIATPSLTKTDDAPLERAATEVGSALRFAHSEAVRTGEPHGVYASQSSERIRIYRLPVSTPIYDVRDPLTKQLYDFDFSIDPTGINVSSVYLKFEGLSDSKNYIGFSAGAGTPKYNDSGTIRMLETGYIRLSYRGAEKTVYISPMTGRVTVQ